MPQLLDARLATCRQPPSAAVIPGVAKEMRIPTVGVVTKPFEFEGKKRGKPAEDGVSQREAHFGMHRSGPGHGT